MARRDPIDFELKLTKIPLRFANGVQAEARSEGNNAAWNCECGTLLVGRCYFQFNDTCHTKCPNCGKKYRVTKNPQKRADAVVEQAA